MDWAAIIVAALASVVAIYTARQGVVAKKRTEQIQQQKVDAEAYRTAQTINRASVERLKDDIKLLHSELARTRRDLNAAREEREGAEVQYRVELQKAKNEWEILERFFRRRIKKLEDALRDSGVPVPNGDGP
jgi:predicted RNase H-like nuclease (RuvC/YqgF family)